MVGKLTKFAVPPGLNTDRTDYSTGLAWWRGNNVRFQDNDVLKYGGSEVEGGYTFTGSPNAQKSWVGLGGDKYLVVGTDEKLELIKNDVKYDITPIESTEALGTDPFTMTNTSADVTVNDGSHGRDTGDWVVFSSATAAHGITIDGEYQVQSVTDANNYVITHSAAATSSGTGGGASVSVDNLLKKGNIGTIGLGWSASAWGDTGGGWGDPATTGVTVEPELWSFDTWGEDLVACRRGGTIYHWDASAGTGTRAAAISNAPATCLFIMVSDNDRHLIAFGAHDGSSPDPLNIAWPDQETLTDWTPTATNTAGSIRAEIGTKLVAAEHVRGQMAVLTDESLYGLSYSGVPYTFGLKHLARGCGAISQRSIVAYDETLYWQGERDFYAFRGAVKVLPCPVHDYIFDDYEPQLTHMFFGGVNQVYNEVLFFYATQGAGAVDKYVSLNTIDGTWSLGSLSRATWSGEPVWTDYPMALDSSGTLYHHETGVDDGTNALPASVESGAIELGEGDTLMLMDRFVADSTVTGNLFLTVYYSKYPGSTEYSKGPYTIDSSTKFVGVRVKGRQARIKLESTAVGDNWRVGVPRLRLKASGKR